MMCALASVSPVAVGRDSGPFWPSGQPSRSWQASESAFDDTAGSGANPSKSTTASDGQLAISLGERLDKELKAAALNLSYVIEVEYNWVVATRDGQVLGDNRHRAIYPREANPDVAAPIARAANSADLPG